MADEVSGENMPNMTPPSPPLKKPNTPALTAEARLRGSKKGNENRRKRSFRLYVSRLLGVTPVRLDYLRRQKFLSSLEPEDVRAYMEWRFDENRLKNPSLAGLQAHWTASQRRDLLQSLDMDSNEKRLTPAQDRLGQVDIGQDDTQSESNANVMEEW